MKRASETADELRREYDMDELLKGAVRGKYAARYKAGTNLVLLDPNVAAAFPDGKAVNAALRLVMELSRIPAGNKAKMNTDSAQSGQPPVVEAGTGQYTSYFENELGEQWIFVRKWGAQTATVYGGDIGWEEPKTVSSPPEKREHYWTAAGVVLNMPEALWLTACWAALQPLSK